MMRTFSYVSLLVSLVFIGCSFARPGTELGHHVGSHVHGHHHASNGSSNDTLSSAADFKQFDLDAEITEPEAEPHISSLKEANITAAVNSQEHFSKAGPVTIRAIPHGTPIDHPSTNTPYVAVRTNTNKKKTHQHRADERQDLFDHDFDDIFDAIDDDSHEHHDDDRDDHDDDRHDHDFDDHFDDDRRKRARSDSDHIDEFEAIEDLSPSGSAQVPSFVTAAAAARAVTKSRANKTPSNNTTDLTEVKIGPALSETFTLSQEGYTPLPPLSAEFVVSKIKQSPLTRISAKIKLSGVGSSLAKNSIKEEKNQQSNSSTLALEVNNNIAQPSSSNSGSFKSIGDILEKLAAERKQQSQKSAAAGNNSLPVDNVDGAGSEDVASVVVLPPSIPIVVSEKKHSNETTTAENISRSAENVTNPADEGEEALDAEGSESVRVVVASPPLGVAARDEIDEAMTAVGQAEPTDVDVKSTSLDMENNGTATNRHFRHRPKIQKANEIGVKFPFGPHEMAHLHFKAPSNTTGSYEVHDGHGRSKMAGFSVDGHGKFILDRHASQSKQMFRNLEPDARLIAVKVGNVSIELTFKPVGDHHHQRQHG